MLAALFAAADDSELLSFITERPKSAYGRRIWFLYEWITDEILPIPGLGKARAVEVVDPDVQFALERGELSARQKVLDNLPGTPDFCPLVSRPRGPERHDLEALQRGIASFESRMHPDYIRRAGAFLEVSDSRASFQIEGERPQASRLQRRGRAIGVAGSGKLTLDELCYVCRGS